MGTLDNSWLENRIPDIAKLVLALSEKEATVSSCLTHS